MNEPTKPGTPPSVEGIVTRSSPFSVEETLARLQEELIGNIAVVDALIEQALQG